MKKNYLKKVLFILCLSFFLLLISVSDFFVDAFNDSNSSNDDNIIDTIENINKCSGTGTLEDPFLISSLENLVWFSEFVNSGNNSVNAILTCNIVMNVNLINEDNELNNGEFLEWTPIGNIDNAYNGTFDGQGYTISGLYHKNDETIYLGLFGRISKGTIKNVNVVDSYLFGRQFIGGIVGDNGGTIENCSYSGYVSATFEGLGGIAGANFGLIKNCINNSKVVGESCINIDTVIKKDNDGNIIYGEDGEPLVNTYTKQSDCEALAGIAGANYGTIEKTSNTGEVTGGANIGGIVGFNNGSITNSINSGNIISESITSYGYAAGIVGYNTALGTIHKSSNTGNVTSSKIYIGGIVGFAEANGVTSVKECYNTGKINGKMYVGGVIGYNQITVENCYNIGEVCGNRNVGGVAGYSVSRNKTISSLINCYNAGNISYTGENPMDIGSVVGLNNKGVVSNCYYLDTTGGFSSNNADSTSKTKEEFASGEVTYLLNEEKTNGVWKQNLEKDACPNFSGLLVIYDKNTKTYYNHSHIWEYSLENDKIYAKCKAENCDNVDGGSISISSPSNLVYTGEAIEVIVSNNLTTNDEVEVIYQANNNSSLTDGKAVNVGKYTASVMINDIKLSVSFEITPLDLSNVAIEVSNITYNGLAQKPSVSISYNGKQLIENTDYFIECINNTNAGIGLATFYGNKNFSGTVYKAFSVFKRVVTVSATSQTIEFGEEISSNGYKCENLVAEHKISISLTASTNKVTTTGTIQVKVNDITANAKSVISNYDVKINSGKLIINPKLSKINSLTTDNVTIDNIADINSIIETIKDADYTNATDNAKKEWDNIVEKCNKLIEKVNSVISTIENISTKVNAYNINTINSNDLEEIEKLIKEVKTLLEGENLNDSQRTIVSSLSDTLNVLKSLIDSAISEYNRINKEIKKYSISSVKSNNLDDLNELLNDINNEISSKNINDEEKNNLISNKNIVIELIEKINTINENIHLITETKNIYTKFTVKTSDKEKLEGFANDIKSLLKTKNITEEEKEILNSSDLHIKEMINFIDEIQSSLNDENIKKASNITSENVLYENKETLMNAKNAYETALSKYSANFTDEEISQIENNISRLDESLKVILDIEETLMNLKDTFIYSIEVILKYFRK